MSDRFCLRALLLASLALPFTGCSSNGLDSITVTPTAVTTSLCGSGVLGIPVQLTATGYYGHGAHPTTTKDLTSQVKWATDTPLIATVSSTGVAEVTISSNGVSGVADITATMQGFGGPIVGTMTMTKTVASTCTTDQPAAKLIKHDE